eukprot:Hpha_TRINITY_DN14099_c0_g1::TRINITY_DN14099_c0_g1_i2::g.43849::m.43849
MSGGKQTEQRGVVATGLCLLAPMWVMQQHVQRDNEGETVLQTAQCLVRKHNTRIADEEASRVTGRTPEGKPIPASVVSRGKEFHGKPLVTEVFPASARGPQIYSDEESGGEEKKED